MRSLASIVLGIVAATAVVTGADARHHRPRHHSYVGLATNDAAFRRAARSYDRAPAALGALIPRGWQAAPRDPDVPGSRFLSPMGDASVSFYAVPANKDAVDGYWKTVALKEGEDLRL